LSTPYSFIMTKIFCVVPAYNEQDNIGKVVKALKSLDYEVIAVDDGSSDHTEKIALENGAIVLRHVINRGQGAALQTGNEYALLKGADIIVHFDADGQFLPEEISDIIKPIIAGEADAVFGSRFLGKEANLPRLKRHFIYPVGRLVNNYILSGSNLSDPQNGFRALSREAAQKIIILNDGMAHNSEIQRKAVSNFRISEVAVTVKYNRYGQGVFSGRGRGSGGLKILKDIILSKIFD
jgi:polyprenyl-phospho-N-acetylgalactosaminyl synthase